MLVVGVHLDPFEPLVVDQLQVFKQLRVFEAERGKELDPLGAEDLGPFQDGIEVFWPGGDRAEHRLFDTDPIHGFKEGRDCAVEVGLDGTPFFQGRDRLGCDVIGKGVGVNIDGTDHAFSWCTS